MINFNEAMICHYSARGKATLQNCTIKQNSITKPVITIKLLSYIFLQRNKIIPVHSIALDIVIHTVKDAVWTSAQQ